MHEFTIYRRHAGSKRDYRFWTRVAARSMGAALKKATGKNVWWYRTKRRGGKRTGYYGTNGWRFAVMRTRKVENLTPDHMLVHRGGA